MNKSTDGFSTLEIILAIVVVVLLGIVGWLTYANQQKHSTTTATSSVSKTYPYAGWKSYTLKYENATFRYPSSWKINNNSMAGSDNIGLTGSNNFSMWITTGGFGHPTGGPATVLSSLPITFLGQKGYVDYTSLSNNNLVQQISLSQSKTNFLDTFKSRASGGNSTPGGNFVIGASYMINSKPNSEIKSISLSKAENDPNFKDAILVIESMHY